MRTNKSIRRTAKRLFRLCMTGGLLDENRLRAVVRRIAGTGARNRLGVLTHLRKLVALEQARHTALIESVVPIAPELKATVEDRLARLYGPGLQASFAEQPLLIGGMRIRVGNDVYDASVRGKLAALQARFGANHRTV